MYSTLNNMANAYMAVHVDCGCEPLVAEMQLQSNSLAIGLAVSEPEHAYCDYSFPSRMNECVGVCVGNLHAKRPGAQK